jgi:hypothetical protein
MGFWFGLIGAIGVALLIFWAGWKFGGLASAEALRAERDLKAAALKDLAKAKAVVDSVRFAASKAGLDVKKVFPFLALLLAIYLARGLI